MLSLIAVLLLPMLRRVDFAGAALTRIMLAFAGVPHVVFIAEAHADEVLLTFDDSNTG